MVMACTIFRCSTGERVQWVAEFWGGGGEERDVIIFLVAVQALGQIKHNIKLLSWGSNI